MRDLITLYVFLDTSTPSHIFGVSNDDLNHFYHLIIFYVEDDPLDSEQMVFRFEFEPQEISGLNAVNDPRDLSERKILNGLSYRQFLEWKKMESTARKEQFFGFPKEDDDDEQNKRVKEKIGVLLGLLDFIRKPDAFDTSDKQ